MDLSTHIAYIMAPKEESEIATIKKACQASMDLYNKYLKEQLMEIIDADKVILCNLLNIVCLCVCERDCVCVREIGCM